MTARANASSSHSQRFPPSRRPAYSTNGSRMPKRGSEAVGVVAVGDVDAAADHTLARRKREQTVGERPLGFRVEPDAARTGEQRAEELERGLGFVVQARLEDRPLRADHPARERGPEQVRREHQRAVLRGVAQQVVVELRHPQVVVHPSLLFIEADALTSQDRRFDRLSFLPGRVEHGGEPAYDELAVLLDPRRELVRPREVIARAGREDLRFPAARGEPFGGFADQCLRAADHVVPEAGRDEADTTPGTHDGRG